MIAYAWVSQIEQVHHIGLARSILRCSFSPGVRSLKHNCKEPAGEAAYFPLGYAPEEFATDTTVL